MAPNGAHFPSHRAIFRGDEGHTLPPTVDAHPTRSTAHARLCRVAPLAFHGVAVPRTGEGHGTTPRFLRVLSAHWGQGHSHLRWTRPDPLAGGLPYRTSLTAISLPRLLPAVCLIFTGICGRHCHVACCHEGGATTFPLVCHLSPSVVARECHRPRAFAWSRSRPPGLRSELWSTPRHKQHTSTYGRVVARLRATLPLT